MATASATFTSTGNSLPVLPDPGDTQATVTVGGTWTGEIIVRTQSATNLIPPITANGSYPVTLPEGRTKLGLRAGSPFTGSANVSVVTGP